MSRPTHLNELISILDGTGIRFEGELAQAMVQAAAELRHLKEIREAFRRGGVSHAYDYRLIEARPNIIEEDGRLRLVHQFKEFLLKENAIHFRQRIGPDGSTTLEAELLVILPSARRALMVPAKT